MESIFKRAYNFLFGKAEKRQTSEVSNPASWFTNLLGGGLTNSGVTVSNEQALGITALWSATDKIAGSIASMPFKVFEKKDGNREEATGHPVNDLLCFLPNDIYIPFNFWYSIIANALLHGSGVAEIIRDADNRPRRLKLIEGRVTPFEGTDGALFYYNFETKGAIPAADILHIHGLMVTDGKNARSIIQCFRETFGEQVAAQMFGQKFFSNGAHLKGYVKHPGKLGDKAFARLKVSWAQSYEGMENVGSTAILEEGAEFKALTVSPKEALYIDTKKFGIEDVSRITNVPLHMLQSLDRATFNNIEVLGLDFVKYTLAPWLVKITQECDRKLFRADERGRFYTKHNLNALLRGDSKSRVEYYKGLFYMGAITANEIRSFEEMNGYENGDEFFSQVNLIPVEQALQGEAKNTTDDGQRANQSK